MTVDDQHFAVLEWQHVLFLEAFAQHGINPVGDFLGRLLLTVLGRRRGVGADEQQGDKKACRTDHEMTPLPRVIASSLSDAEASESRSHPPVAAVNAGLVVCLTGTGQFSMGR